MRSLVREPFKSRSSSTVYYDGLREHRHGPDPQASLAVEGSIDDEFFFGFGVLRYSNDLVFLAFVMPIATRLDHRVSFSATHYTGTEDGITESAEGTLLT